MVASVIPGGRDGSHLHSSTELLYHPGHYTLAGGRELRLDRWSWAHQAMLNTRVWGEAVPPGMKTLPLPLSGHCAVDIRHSSDQVKEEIHVQCSSYYIFLLIAIIACIH